MRTLLVAMMLGTLGCAGKVMVVKVHCDGNLTMSAETIPDSGMLHPIPPGTCKVGVDTKKE